MSEDAILIANTSFSADVNGVPEVIHKGVTRIRASHPLARQNPDYFTPISDDVHFDVEEATAKPGKKRAK